jgi:hypothetical protein
MAADLFNKTGRRSRSLADCLIAAVAIRCGAKLATVNTGDFQAFVQYGLTVYFFALLAPPLSVTEPMLAQGPVTSRASQS